MSSGKIVQVIGPRCRRGILSRPILTRYQQCVYRLQKDEKKTKVVLEAALETRGWCDPHHRNESTDGFCNEEWKSSIQVPQSLSL